jgi:D-glutamate cyclase
MVPETTYTKILLMEETINFPARFLSTKNKHNSWENLPMVPYSNLHGAVSSLSEKGRKVAIVTGFYIPTANPPAPETDGPPGALILAEGLNYLGVEVLLISDPYTLPLLKAGLDILGLSEREIPLVLFPMEAPDPGNRRRLSNEESDSPTSLHFVQEFFDGPLGKDLTHLIYIERVGPSHTLASFLAQRRSGAPPLREFEATLPPSMRDRCLNVRLSDITGYTAKTHLLAEYPKKRGLNITTIGIGDRGNEIGAGKVPWEVFYQQMPTRREATFCCRVPTDFLVASGISNWGGYALIAGVSLARGRLDIIQKVTPDQEMKILDYLIHHGPAVDGITRKQDRSVDGIEFEDYMRVIERVKEIALEEP